MPQSPRRKPSETWEFIERHDQGNTYRIAVPGGWIYRMAEYCEGRESITAVFVPAPNYP